MKGEIIQIMAAEKLPFLTELYRRGIELIKTIQQIENPAMTVLVKFITTLGSAYFLVPLLLLVFWCIDEKRGIRLVLLTALSSWANVSLKILFAQPRPFHLEPELGLVPEPGYGIPSGHAQTSLIVYFPLASWTWNRFRKNRSVIYAITILLILLIGFSRLYLGVHFPTDLLAGWLLGIIFLALFYILSPYLTVFLRERGMRGQLIASAAAALIMNGIAPGDSSFPALFLGAGSGYSLMKHHFPFSASAPLKGKKPPFLFLALRFVLGGAGAAIIFIALKFILPGEKSIFADLPFWGASSPYQTMGAFIRFCILGLWVTAGAPRLFLMAGLAELEPDAAKAGREKT
ncbi:MAG: phosphatase PAP2 family protein [Treponema sp.]|jgi:membrane-associated phospholipid phosphatase|nr:phosphatase PAP2 family protein [Treponema sp.]